MFKNNEVFPLDNGDEAIEMHARAYDGLFEAKEKKLEIGLSVSDMLRIVMLNFFASDISLRFMAGVFSPTPTLCLAFSSKPGIRNCGKCGVVVGLGFAAKPIDPRDERLFSSFRKMDAKKFDLTYGQRNMGGAYGDFCFETESGDYLVLMRVTPVEILFDPFRPMLTIPDTGVSLDVKEIQSVVTQTKEVKGLSVSSVEITMRNKRQHSVVVDSPEVAKNISDWVVNYINHHLSTVPR